MSQDVDVPRAPFDWESLVGVRMFSWLGGVTIFLGAIFLFRYSVEHGWLRPLFRAIFGFGAGVALLAGSQTRRARQYAVSANAISATAILILYATSIACRDRWHLFGSGAVFALMILCTAGAVGLSIARDSYWIAVMALAGGFSTPYLLRTGEDHPISLFAYLLLLNAGLAWVAYRKKWPALIAISTVLTTLYQWGWAAKFLTVSKLPLALGIFLVFPVFTAVAYAAAQRGEARKRDSLLDNTVAISSLLPLLFALFLGAVPAYGANSGSLFVYLLCIDIGIAVLAGSRRGPEVLHVVASVATLLTFGVWVGVSYQSSMWPSVLAWNAVFVLLYLAVPFVLSGLRRPLEREGKGAVLVAPLLLFVYPILAAREPATASPGLLFGILFALMAAIALAALLLEKGVIYRTAAVFAVAAQWVWSSEQLRLENLSGALGFYAAFALFFLAVPALARRFRRRMTRSVAAGTEAYDSGSWIALSGHVFLLFVVLRPELARHAAALLAVLALLDLAAGVAALYLRRAGLHLAAVVATQILLVFLVATLSDAPYPRIASSYAIGIAAFAAVLLIAGYLLHGTGEPSEGSPWASPHPVSLYGLATAFALFGAWCVLMVSIVLPGAPAFAFVLTATLLLLVSILALVERSGWHGMTVLAVVPAALTATLWTARAAATWGENALLGAALYAVFLAAPVVFAMRGRNRREPYLAAVLFSLPWFLLARSSFMDAGWNDRIGLLPLAQAGLLLGLVVHLVRIEPAERRDRGRLALVAGAALAFLTAAVPLQLEKQWITVAWALETAALCWLFRRLRHTGLLLWSGGLAAAVFVRLVLNPAVFGYHLRAAIPIWNWYLYTYAVCAAAFFAAAVLLRREEDHIEGTILRFSSVLSAAGVVFLFVVLNIEIADWFSRGASITFDLFSRNLGQSLAYTLGWALFAIALLIAGIALRTRAARIAALGLLIATILKCFLYDLLRLGGLYVVGSLLGLGICLFAVAILLQKFVMAPRGE